MRCNPSGTRHRRQQQQLHSVQDFPPSNNSSSPSALLNSRARIPEGPPSSVDRLSEVDDEVDVDVEECSDSEEASRSGQDRRASSRATATPNSVSDEERLTPEPASKRSTIVGSCNSDDLRPVQCHLETKELWDKFNELGTEMIITKTGREVVPYVPTSPPVAFTEVPGVTSVRGSFPRDSAEN
ncbi:AAEL011188-PA [Aedes aegypti]|uniref:AAEL011188-PA n=1 Tax=Aedes aegypti TaxID=7159 RepID=Q16QT0_AEDAE|nr:AAEL011188-PA [Aedes aegypti]